jgi:sulfate/thiosulfate-binding protein
MLPRHPGRAIGAFLSLLALAASACASSGSADEGASGPCTPAESPVITLAAYSNVYETYGKLVSSFQSLWKEEHDDQQVIVQTSFGGSTTQAENVVNGFPADIVALSLAPDVTLIEEAGLITHDWENERDGSIVATAAVVFAVRPGNPKNLDNWDDLAQPGVEILTPDPAQSGGARWNILAAYGAAMRGEVPGYEANNAADAQRLLEGIFRNVTVLDKSANDSLKNFEAGNGDVALNYDYAVQAAIEAGQEDEMVVPPSTIAIQTPVVVVDENAKENCVLPVANAFVEYLHTPEAQEVFQTVGFERPIDVAKAQKGTDLQPPVEDFFTVDDLGGWDELDESVFGESGLFTEAFQAAQG